ncbi:uncharacterized protein [Hetaerina americana]|uniref:uncharacterized protein isoform X2 n=1 Tax=Hetaerina americana TaxID=62018 RepID=UPI003A7F45B3
MMSLRILLCIAVCLAVQHSVLSDPISRDQVTFNEEECKHVTEVVKRNFKSCIGGHFIPEDEARRIYNESRCPICAHICGQLQSILKCTYDAVEADYPCNAKMQGVGRRFFRSIFEATGSFFCEDGGDKLTTMNDNENMRCILSKEGRCQLDIIQHYMNRENNSASGGHSSESRDSMQESSCRVMIGGVICLSKKAELCSDETANVLNSFAEYFKRSSPCSKYFSEN